MSRLGLSPWGSLGGYGRGLLSYAVMQAPDFGFSPTEREAGTALVAQWLRICLAKIHRFDCWQGKISHAASVCCDCVPMCTEPTLESL